jgi:hypothetical protein
LLHTLLMLICNHMDDEDAAPTDAINMPLLICRSYGCYYYAAPTELGCTGISFLLRYRSYGACIHLYLISIHTPFLRSWKTVKLNQALTINNSSLVSSSLVSSSPYALYAPYMFLAPSASTFQLCKKQDEN